MNSDYNIGIHALVHLAHKECSLQSAAFCGKHKIPAFCLNRTPGPKITLITFRGESLIFSLQFML